MTVIKQHNGTTWEPVLVGAGVPPGGTVGQVVGKASATNYDTEWVDQSGGISQAAADARYVNLDGDSMTGGLTVDGDLVVTSPGDVSARSFTSWGHVGAESVFQHLGCDTIYINQSFQVYTPIYLDGTANVPTDPRHATSKGYVDGQVATKQPLDTDLTALAGLTATTDNFIVSVASVWASRTPAQVKTTLALDQVNNTTDANKPVSTAQATAIGLKADKTITVTGTGSLSGGGDLSANRTLDVAAAGITLAKMANLAQDQVIGRVTASTGVPETFTVTAAARGVLDDTTTAAMLVTLGGQPLDTDLTAIAGLTATTGNIIQSVAGVWASQTPTQVKAALVIGQGDVTNLVTDLGNKQPLDADLTTIAGLTATTDNVIQSVSGAWASRTPAQVKTSLALTKTDVGLANVDNTSDVNKPVSTAQATADGLKADKTTTVTGTGSLTGGGDLSVNRTLDVAADGITNAKLANVSTNTIKGRTTAATGDPEDLTPAQARTVIASDSGGGTSNFFRADGAWAAPPGGGGGIDQATADGLYINITGDTMTGPLSMGSQLLNIQNGDLSGNSGGIRLNSYAGKTLNLATNNTTRMTLSDTDLTSLVPIILPADPASNLQAATKQYVDNLAAGLAWKEAVRVASTANGTLATAFANGQVVDTITLATGNRILLKNQTTTTENGIWIVTAGAPTRATDADAVGDLEQATVFVSEGGQADTAWVCSTNGTITPGTTGTTWVQFGAGAVYTAGAGLTGTTTFDVVADSTITVTADQISRAALTGEVTAPAGSNATTIATSVVTNAKLANANGLTLKGNNTGSAAPVIDMTAAQAKTLLAITESDVTNLVTDLGNKQPLDADLTTIAGLTPTTGNVIQSVAGVWASQTPAQVKTALAIAEADVANLVTDLGNKQPLDTDLTTIAGLTATTDNIIQSSGSAWASRTPTQVKTALALDQVNNTSDANKPVSTAQATAIGLKQDADADLTAIAALAPGNDTVIQRKAGVWVASTPATVKTDLVLTKTDVGLANVDNTSDANKPVSTAQATADGLALPKTGGAMTGLLYLNGVDLYGRSTDGLTNYGRVGFTNTDVSLIGMVNRPVILNVGGAAILTAAATLVTSTMPIALPADPGSALHAATKQYVDTKQPLDTDLTTIAGLTATTGNIIQSVGSAWASQTPAQVKTALAIAEADVTNLVTDLGNKQPLDADLTTIAGLTATTDNIIQSVAGVWASRTPAQVKTALALDQVNNTTDANKPVSTAQATAIALKVDNTRTLTTTAPLTIGGGASADLSANRTLDINTFTLTVKGAVPPPTTATGKFLKDDGTWAVAGGGGSAASETVAGIAEIATQAEVTTGTDDTRMVSPLKLKTYVDSRASMLSWSGTQAQFDALASLDLTTAYYVTP